MIDLGKCGYFVQGCATEPSGGDDVIDSIRLPLALRYASRAPAPGS